VAAFHPKLLEAESANVRMDALCEFIEFWMGPRQSAFGESASALAERSLPMPLKVLYAFAGHWPHWDYHGPIEYNVPAFSHQDSLVALGKLKCDADGKVVFLYENQSVWDCRTLVDGNDPPVWCNGEQEDENGNWLRRERLICDSLSRFLTTFVLQEITFGSRLYLRDENLANRFEAARASAIPIWTEGVYVHGWQHNYFLWEDVLVANFSGTPFFAANRQAGIDFLTESQSPITSIQLNVLKPWTLDIRSDGSARIRYLKRRREETADAPPDSFRFQEVLEMMSVAISNEGNWERNPLVVFHRKGQSGRVEAKHLRNAELVTSLFQFALKKAIQPNRTLEMLFTTDWPF
jgi:hypothetical protein